MGEAERLIFRNVLRLMHAPAGAWRWRLTADARAMSARTAQPTQAVVLPETVDD